MSYLYFSLELISECLCYLCGIYFFTKVSLTKNIKIYAVKENITILDVTDRKLQLTCDIINTYEELLELIK